MTLVAASFLISITCYLLVSVQRSLKEFPLPLGAEERMLYIIVALLWPSIMTI